MNYKNILPKDGEALYFGKIMENEQVNQYFQILWNEIAWKNDEAIIFGKKIITKRKVAWYGDKPFEYTYSNIRKQALPWTSSLLEIRNLVQDISNENFNSCLLNLYHDGSEGMAWHSDAEKDLKKEGAIASLSIGAERKFSLKHKKSQEKIDILLENGSLLVMKGITQIHWLHRLPQIKKINHPRINLTFRTINE